MMLETLFPTHTDWGLLVKKSSRHLHKEALKPKGDNLPTRCCGIMVLNAELKCTNTCALFSSRCVRL